MLASRYQNLVHTTPLGPGWLNELGSWITYQIIVKPITNTAWVRARLCKLQQGCTRLAAASDKVYKLLINIEKKGQNTKKTKSQSRIKIVKLPIKKLLAFCFTRQGLSGPWT